MKLTMGELGVPVGSYRARFVGVEAREPLPGTEYGPGLEWKFEVLDGPMRGRTTSRTTGQQPTVKNACGRMVSSLAGGTVGLGQEFDAEACRGKVYVVRVEPNSTGSGTRVGDVMPADVFAGGTYPAVPAPTGAPPPPPPPPLVGPTGAPLPPPPPALVGREYFVLAEPGKMPVKMTEDELRKWVALHSADPAVLQVCPVGETQWRMAADFGLSNPLPF